MPKLSRNARRAIARHGEDLARKAYKMHQLGDGASHIGIYLNITTNQADALINAGREIADGGPEVTHRVEHVTPPNY